eukprot:3048590-Rhodomonas_salina.1
MLEEFLVIESACNAQRWIPSFSEKQLLMVLLPLRETSNVSHHWPQSRPLCTTGSQSLLHPEIHYKKPHFEYNLYQECGCQCPVRVQFDCRDTSRAGKAWLGALLDP